MATARSPRSPRSRRSRTAPARAAAGDRTTAEAGGLSAEGLLGLSSRELADVFRRSPAGAVPDGDCDGTALVAPGTPLAAPVARLTRLLAWRGKSFDAAGGRLRNRLGPLGLRFVPARVYVGPSLLDGRDCIVLDYSRTSLVARFVRDELREVAPGLYLGRAYAFGRAVLFFALRPAT